MLSIEKSQTFQKDYNFLMLRIKKLENEIERKSAELLLDNLLNCVRQIDKEHADLGFNNRLPSSTPDTRKFLSDVRKMLDKKLRENGV